MQSRGRKKDQARDIERQKVNSRERWRECEGEEARSKIGESLEKGENEMKGSVNDRERGRGRSQRREIEIGSKAGEKVAIRRGARVCKEKLEEKMVT